MNHEIPCFTTYKKTECEECEHVSSDSSVLSHHVRCLGESSVWQEELLAWFRFWDSKKEGEEDQRSALGFKEVMFSSARFGASWVFLMLLCVCAILEWRVVGTLSTKGGWAAIGKNMNNQS